MPKTIQLPDNSVVAFPDDMSDQDISQAIDRHMMSRPDLQPPPGMPKPSEMETSVLGHLAPRDVPHNQHAGASQESMPGFEGMNASNDQEKADAMTGAGAASLGALLFGPKVAPFVAPAVASYAINKARNLPVIGPVIEHIPFAEMLPFLAMGGKGGNGSATAEAEAGAAKVERDATLNRRNIPEYAGDEAPISHPAAKAVTYRDATINRRNIPEYAGEEVPAASSAATPRTAAAVPSAKSGLPPVLQQGLESSSASNAGEAFGQRKIIPSTRNIRENSAMAKQAEQARPAKGYSSGESVDDRALGQEFRQDLATHGEQAEEEMRREFAAGSTTGVTKQDLTGAPDKPVVYTKTKSASGKGTVKPSSPVATKPEDVVPLMEKMLRNARKGKGLQQ